MYRVTIDAGFTCPNVDGSVAVGGCVYCDNRSFSPNRRLPRATVRDQVERGVALLHQRYGADACQAFSVKGLAPSTINLSKNKGVSRYSPDFSRIVRMGNDGATLV